MLSNARGGDFRRLTALALIDRLNRFPRRCLRSGAEVCIVQTGWWLPLCFQIVHALWWCVGVDWRAMAGLIRGPLAKKSLCLVIGSAKLLGRS